MRIRTISTRGLQLVLGTAPTVKKRRVTVAVVILMSLGFSASGALASAPDGQHPDSISYARSNGVTVTEASRRLDLQVAAGELDAQIAGTQEATYGGLWIQHTPDFRIVVLATDGDSGIWRSLPASAKLEGLVEVRPANYTLAELEREALAFGDKAHALRVDMEVNVMENRIDLSPTPATLANDFSNATLPPMMWRDSQVRVGGPAADSYGGLGLSNGCTTGFTVQTTTPVPLMGVVTAGHCDNSATLGGLAITFQSEAWSGSNDEQWYSTPNHNDLRQFFDGSSNRSVVGITTRGNQAINSYVCKYGTATGYRCGYLESKSFQPSWVPNALATFHRADPQGGPDMVNGGDSGGPVFNSNYAWGIVEGEYGFPWCICELIYTPVDYVQSGLGVLISIQ